MQKETLFGRFGQSEHCNSVLQRTLFHAAQIGLLDHKSNARRAARRDHTRRRFQRQRVPQKQTGRLRGI